MNARLIGNVYGDYHGGSFGGCVWDTLSLSPTLKTGASASQQCVIVAMRGREEPTKGVTEHRLEPNKEGMCNTLTSVQKDNLVMVQAIDEQNMNVRDDTFGTIMTDGSSPKKNNRVLIKCNTETGYQELDINGVCDLSYPDSTTRRGRVQEGGNVSPTLTAAGDVHKIENSTPPKKYRIRKLTPRECWRLMGFTDKEFEAAESVNSNTQLYKQAGNSIVVNVLEEIFKEIIKCEGGQEMMEGTYGRFTVDALELPKMFDINKLREKEPELFDELCEDYPVDVYNIFMTIKGDAE